MAQKKKQKTFTQRVGDGDFIGLALDHLGLRIPCAAIHGILFGLTDSGVCSVEDLDNQLEELDDSNTGGHGRLPPVPFYPVNDSVPCAACRSNAAFLLG